LQATPPYFPQIVHFVGGAAEILYALSESRTIGSYPNFASSKGRWEKPAKGNTFHQRSNVEKESLGSSRVSPKKIKLAISTIIASNPLAFGEASMVGPSFSGASHRSESSASLQISAG
jgi:hypothetical protein